MNEHSSCESKIPLTLRGILFSKWGDFLAATSPDRSAFEIQLDFLLILEMV